MSNSADLAQDARQAFAAGDYAKAQQLAAEHLLRVPTSLDAQSMLANASNALGDYERAITAIEALHAARPQDIAIRKALATSCNNRGSQFYHAGDLDRAAGFYERAVRLDETFALAWTNLAACAAQRRKHALAATCNARLLALDAGNVDAALRFAYAMHALGKYSDAETVLESIPGDKLNPEHRFAFARVFECLGKPDRAAAIFEGNADIDAGMLERMVKVQAACGNVAGAQGNLERIAARTDRESRGRFRAERDAALLMPAVFASHAEIVTTRAAYAVRMQQFVSDWPPPRLARCGVRIDDLCHAHLRVAYQGENDLALACAYGDWLAASAGHLLAAPATARPATPIRRIGVVSPHWIMGTIATYFGAWPQALQSAGAEVYLYTTSNQQDAISQRITSRFKHACSLPADLAAAAARIRADELDLLIYPEVGLGNGATEVLAALRLAPRQWVAWGHPVTTGLPTVDRYISVSSMEPPAGANDYREPLLCLPGIGTRFARPAIAAPASRERFGLPDGGALYLLPHSPLKLHPDTDELVAAILQRDATARIAFFVDALPVLTLAHRRRLEARLAREGIDTANRLFWLPYQPEAEFHGLLAATDVVVDTMHFSGGATSIEAFAQNTPIVTVEGRHMRGRQTAAMLRMLDLPDLICADAGAAAARAVALAKNPDERARMRARLVERTPVLFGQTEPLRALCEHVRHDGATP